MASIANIVLIPCALGPALTVTNIADGAAFFRAPTPQPLGVVTIATSGGPIGPQRWPVKL
jgi:hypothetical protein